MSAHLLFERFELRPAERRLLEGGQPVALGARAFDLLVTLVQHRDRVVGKDELLSLVWPGLIVEENNLTVQVSALRKALGADAIATVAGRGYRFTLPVQEPAARAGADAAASDLPPHNLPAERSSFIGRGPETQAVRTALVGHRLVTLTGIGGSGKTRLALRVADMEWRAVPCRYPHGVYFVDLAPVADPDLVPQALAQACGLTPGDSTVGSGRSFTDRLVGALATRHCLLLLDNCEHLLDACAALVDRLLEGCDQVVLLATSREALGVEGERLLQVPSLTVPDASASAGVTDAMQLFADRAQAVQASFCLDAQTLPVVAEVCRRLDGIPLAIELAAARVAHLTPAEVARRLGDRFHLLTGGRRRIARQQTLGAALDWSHDLLHAPEQVAFRRLAVFAGSFPLAAAEAVCVDDAGQMNGARPVAPADVLDLLGSLVAKSLVTVVPDEHGQTRYRLLETVRLYALDKLDAAGETRALRVRHRDHWLGWVQAMPLDHLLFEVAGMQALGREIDNLRAAADWCLADDRPDLLVRLVTRMFGHWLTGSSYRVARQLLDEALRQESRLSIDERVAGHAVQAWLNVMALNLPEVLAHATRAVDEDVGVPSHFQVMGRAIRGFGLAVLASIPGADPALITRGRRDGEQAYATARAGLSGGCQAQAALMCAYVEMHVGEYEAAARWYEACVDVCESSGLQGWVLATALSGLAASQHLMGRNEAALQAAQRFLALKAALDVRWPWVDGFAVEVTPALQAGGCDGEVDDVLSRSGAALWHSGVDLAPNQFLCVAAVVAFLRGDATRAGCLLGAARNVGGAHRETMAFRTPTSLACYAHYLPLVRAALGPNEAHLARDRGRAMTPDEAYACALVPSQRGAAMRAR